MPGQCCPEYKKTACKDGEYVYQVIRGYLNILIKIRTFSQIGVSWNFRGSCTRKKCVEADGEAKAEVIVAECPTKECPEVQKFFCLLS